MRMPDTRYIPSSKNDAGAGRVDDGHGFWAVAILLLLVFFAIHCCKSLLHVRINVGLIE